MYVYRIGEKKSIAAEVDDATHPATPPIVASAKIRLYNVNNQQVWERPAVVEANVVKYQMVDPLPRGMYTVQWVLTIGLDTVFSDLMKLQVKTASEV